MSMDGIPEIPPGADQMQTVTVHPAKQTTFMEFAVLDPQPLPDGGMQLVFVVPATREAYVFPMNPEAVEALGKKLLAPRVALPGGNGGGLHAV